MGKAIRIDRWNYYIKTLDILINLKLLRHTFIVKQLNIGLYLDIFLFLV